MKVIFERVDNPGDRDDEKTEIVLEDQQPVVLGRGPLLKIDGTNISRNKLSIRVNNEGCLVLKCLKAPPVIIDHDSTDGSQQTVQVSKVEHKVSSGDVIKFDQNQFFFKVSYENCDNNTHNESTNNKLEIQNENVTQISDSKERKRNISEEQGQNEYEQQRRPNKKPRKLPDWMLMLEDDKENVKKSEPKHLKGKGGKSPNKTARNSISNANEKAQLRHDSPSKKISDDKSLTEVSNDNNFTNDNKIVDTCETKDDVTQTDQKQRTKNDSVQTIIQESRDDSVQTENQNTKDDSVQTTSAENKKDNMENIMERKVGEVVLTESLLMDSDSNENVGMVYPVLINPSDLQDSDDESAKAKPAKPKKKKPIAGRPKCPYGENCYRKNPVHFQQESHPGDDDYDEEEEKNDPEDDDRPECEYGVDCYRKNPQHKRDFKHSHKPQPKRKAKKKAGKKKERDDEDEYESDFIDDSEVEEDIDDTDDDENWTPPDSDED